jgi:hypothetical protein
MSDVAYPVSVSVEPTLANRNRLTVAFRLILAIPHMILVGGLGIGFASGNDPRINIGSETGLLGVVAYFLAIVAWFAIVFADVHPAGIRQFSLYYMRWRVRALAYLTLLQDVYPPFGDSPYPASLEIVEPTGPRDRLSVGLRIVLAIPQLIVLFFILFAWALTTILSWFVILFTGVYPRSLYEFGVGALRWLMRVEAYMLLLVDDYPPFSLT